MYSIDYNFTKKKKEKKNTDKILYGSVSQGRGLPNSWIWLAEIDIENGPDFPIYSVGN